MITSITKWWLFATALVALLAGSLALYSRTQFYESEHFKYVVIDSAPPHDPWGKSAGDINGDGLPDLIVGGHSPRKLNFYERILNKLHLKKIEWPVESELVWYENPNWQKHLVSDKGRFRTDHEVVDVDRDGKNDIISLTDSGLVWFKNPVWSLTVIDNRKLHDIEVCDFDDDGDVDIVARNQGLFNYNNGDQLHFYRQDTPSKWVHFTIAVPQGEGLKVADMDGDKRPDVIVNNNWYKNPGVLTETNPWPTQAYCPTWKLTDVFIDTTDINMDGKMDIILAPAEMQGDRYHISWCEAPTADGSEWREHIVDPDVEAIHHFVAARDMDNDGNIDIVTAKMIQGDDPDEIAVYWNLALGDKWKKEVIATTGSHSMRVVDLDNDGDFDLFGANWQGEHQSIELWLNQTNQVTQSEWQRHVIGAHRPWRSVFIMSADLDQDGYKDIVTGAWWYHNPGSADDIWPRNIIGKQANNAAIINDFDRDGDLDILASEWNEPRKWTLYERLLRKLHIRSYSKDGGFVWARNDGIGHFDILHNVDSGEGDFLQGAVAVAGENNNEVALSWHNPAFGIQMLRVPVEPANSRWNWRRISVISQDEALSTADIDKDGVLDLVLGTKWLRNEGNNGWTPFTFSPGDQNPDRNKIADINGDGELDVIIGYEAISTSGKIAWYEKDAAPTQQWKEHFVAEVVGPMSLDVADMDKDGDLDIIVGEHNLINPETARLLIYENINGSALKWQALVIYTGDEHHDGTQAVDIDNDGDMDIISIGWGHDNVLLYENKGYLGQQSKNVTDSLNYSTKTR